jgi:hypothetical protein
MIAADVGADTAMIDYLLAKAVSPAERDHVRGCVLMPTLRSVIS